MRPKHVSITINKLITKYTIVVCDDNYKFFVYLVFTVLNFEIHGVW
jgi:hypothetical protein